MSSWWWLEWRSWASLQGWISKHWVFCYAKCWPSRCCCQTNTASKLSKLSQFSLKNHGPKLKVIKWYKFQTIKIVFHCCVSLVGGAMKLIFESFIITNKKYIFHHLWLFTRVGCEFSHPTISWPPRRKSCLVHLPLNLDLSWNSELHTKKKPQRRAKNGSGWCEYWPTSREEWLRQSLWDSRNFHNLSCSWELLNGVL